jgi:hypothetical protein
MDVFFSIFSPSVDPRQCPVRLAYQPPVSSTFLSEQTNYQQPASSTFLSEQISTSHQPNEQAAVLLNVRNQNLAFIIE